MNTSRRIKELRKQKNITQKELAIQTGIAISSIINYENSKREPNSKAMAALENFFCVSGSYLRGETELRDDSINFNDEEMNKSLVDEFSPLFQDAIISVAKCDSCQRQTLLNILVELNRTLKITDIDKKGEVLSFIQMTIAQSNKLVQLPKKE